MLEDSSIIDYINNEIENEFIDFKLNIYDWSNAKSKGDFLNDIICLANSNAKGDKYIITGVKVKPDGERKIKGIETSEAKDSAIYQELVTENIEPSISIEFKIIGYDSKKFGIFRIFECNDRPYLLKKKYGNYERGYIKVRKGSRNTNISRYILDSIYKEKNSNNKSQFKISGIVNGKISDDIVLNSYDFFPDFYEEKDNLKKLIKEINNFEIDDFEENNEKILNTPLTNSLFKSEAIKLDEEVIENIKSFAKAVEIKLDHNFFYIGNVSKCFDGFSSSNGYLGPLAKYKETGSMKSLKKYKLILDLDNRIKRVLEWLVFLDEIKDYKFIQLAISEIGNISNEEIEVNIELPKDTYIDTEEFPKVHEDIREELNREYSRKMFMPEYENDISDFRRMPLSTNLHISSSPTFPFYDSSVESIDTIYDFIDYDVLEKQDKTIINFTIKNIKVGETMVFPGNIIIKNKIDSIGYSIISKNSKNKHIGKLIIKK